MEDTNEPKPGGPANDGIEEGAAPEENPALGPFLLAVGECAEALARVKERLDDHLGVPPDGVAWGHVADADRLLLHLRRAAFAAGVGEEPLS